MSQRARWTAFGAVLALIATTAAALAQDRSRVDIADKRLVVAITEGSGLLPLFLSPDWGRPRPEVIRVLIIFHGNGRNAKSYFNTAKKARRIAGEQGRGTLIVAPQFLADGDLKNDPPDDAHMLLRWTAQTWKDGEPALGPVPLSSFEAIDAVLARLANRTIFPNLVNVVIAGHSAGGQIVQRYAIVGTGSNKLTAIGVHVRYVVANPSSYAYFNEDRPYPTADCPTFDNWKYGMKKRPPYAANTAPADFERTYAEREVVYLLGSDDIDPHAAELDRRCEAEVQGKFRRARGEAYFAYMQKRHPTLGHRLQLVPGVAHSAGQMFTSACGVGVLFDWPGCEGRWRSNLWPRRRIAPTPGPQTAQPVTLQSASGRAQCAPCALDLPVPTREPLLVVSHRDGWQAPSMSLATSSVRLLASLGSLDTHRRMSGSAELRRGSAPACRPPRGHR